MFLQNRTRDLFRNNNADSDDREFNEETIFRERFSVWLYSQMSIILFRSPAITPSSANRRSSGGTASPSGRSPQMRFVLASWSCNLCNLYLAHFRLVSKSIVDRWKAKINFHRKFLRICYPCLMTTRTTTISIFDVLASREVINPDPWPPPTYEMYYCIICVPLLTILCCTAHLYILTPVQCSVQYLYSTLWYSMVQL